MVARLLLVNVDDMTPDQRAQYDRFPSNLTRALLLADPRVSEALPNLANALRAALLPPKLREAVILRVAALHDSAYERMQHLDEARRQGWSEEDIAGIETGSPPREVADLLGFVDEVVRTGDASDKAFGRATTHLVPRDLAGVLLLIGHYMMVARFTKVLRVELDEHADSWTHEH